MPQKLRIDDLLTFEPITAAQETVYKAWDEGNHIVMAGSAGTGKTFSALYLALEQALDKSNPPSKEWWWFVLLYPPVK